MTVDAELAGGHLDYATAGFARLVEQALEELGAIGLAVTLGASLNDIPIQIKCCWKSVFVWK